jgi:hypothetical protein
MPWRFAATGLETNPSHPLTVRALAPLRFCDDPVTPTFCFPSPDEPHSYVVQARDSSRSLSPPSAPLVVPAS